MFQYSEFKEFLDDKKSTKTTNSKKTVIKSFSGFQKIYFIGFVFC